MSTLEIALVGAHMTGLPLNGEIAALQGRFARAGQTQDCYRLFVLPGGPPQRPGLLRVGASAGRAIAVEVWAIPSDRIGALLATIPAPLGLGTIRLADGTTPKGFLVEAEGVRGAEDISHYGGWRGYLARPAGAVSAAGEPDVRPQAVETAAALFGITLQPEWRDAASTNFATIANAARLVMDFPLEDEAEYGPVFTP